MTNRVTTSQGTYKEICFLCLLRTDVIVFYLPAAAHPNHPITPLRVCKSCLLRLIEQMLHTAIHKM